MAVETCSSVPEYERYVKGDGLTVVDFTASWCGPCKIMAPKVDALASIYGHVQFIKIDVDEAQEVASLANVSAMPTFQFYRSGKLLATVVGADVAQLKANLQLYGSS